MPRSTFRFIITSPENWEKVNEKNKKLVDRFLKDKATRSSDLTIRNYRSDAEIFFTWNFLHNDNKFFVDIKKIDFSDFFSFVVETMKWGAARTNRVRSFLSSFSQFIEKFYDEEFPLFKSVILRVIESTPKDVRREKTILSDDEVENLLKHFSVENPQLACWLALAVCSGARFSELLRFKLDMINPEITAFGDLFLETPKIKTKGRGKAGKLLNKYILKNKYLPYHEEWIKIRKDKVKDEHGFLFIKQDGTPATETTAREWIKKIEKFLGRPAYAHMLRHRTVTLLAEKKIPDALIIELMGWAGGSGGAMINIYNDLSAKDRQWDELENLK